MKTHPQRIFFVRRLLADKRTILRAEDLFTSNEWASIDNIELRALEGVLTEDSGFDPQRDVTYCRMERVGRIEIAKDRHLKAALMEMVRLEEPHFEFFVVTREHWSRCKCSPTIQLSNL